jgi:hypothetical protein
MKKELFKAVFEKAKNQSGSTTRNGLSNHLENVFMDELKLNVNSITFIRYYKKYIEDDTKIRNNPNSDLLNKSAEYIGYNNYEDFVSKTRNSIEKESTKTIVSDQKLNWINNFFKVKKNKIFIFLGIISLVILLIIFSIEKHRWMVWNNDHYVEVNFDTKKYNVGQLKIYKEERIKNFKKLEPSCEIKYFNTSGNVNVWYGKNTKGELEIFTSVGLHPETGKTLKPITRYMIRKYICSNY